jgi:hypothetical protein
MDCPAAASLFARLSCDIHSNFVAWWKAASIVATAALGILGLVKDFRNKRTHHVTNWGWALLAGMIVTAFLGVIAQWKESNDDAEQTLTIVNNTSDAVKLMSSLAGATVDITYSVNCVASQGHPCPNLASVENQLAEAEIPVYLDADPAKAKHFTDGVSDDADLRWQLRRETPADEYTFGESGEGPANSVSQLTVRGYKITPINPEAVEDQIWTISDLPGKTILIHGGAILSNDVTITTIKIRMWDGESKVAGPFQRIPQPANSTLMEGRGPQVVYIYVFPKPATNQSQ